MPCPVIGWFGDYYDRKYFRRADFFFTVTPDISRHLVAKGARPHRVFTVNTFGTMPDSPDLEPLFATILKTVPPPSFDPDVPLRAHVTNLDASQYLGRLALLRVHSGAMRAVALPA